MNTYYSNPGGRVHRCGQDYGLISPRRRPAPARPRSHAISRSWSLTVAASPSMRPLRARSASVFSRVASVCRMIPRTMAHTPATNTTRPPSAETIARMRLTNHARRACSGRSPTHPTVARRSGWPLPTHGLRCVLGYGWPGRAGAACPLAGLRRGGARPLSRALGHRYGIRCACSHATRRSYRTTNGAGTRAPARILEPTGYAH